MLLWEELSEEPPGIICELSVGEGDAFVHRRSFFSGGLGAIVRWCQAAFYSPAMLQCQGISRTEMLGGGILLPGASLRF